MTWDGQEVCSPSIEEEVPTYIEYICTHASISYSRLYFLRSRSSTPASCLLLCLLLLLPSPLPAYVSCSCLNPLLLQVPVELQDTEPAKTTVLEKAEEEEVEDPLRRCLSRII